MLQTKFQVTGRNRIERSRAEQIVGGWPRPIHPRPLLLSTTLRVLLEVGHGFFFWRGGTRPETTGKFFRGIESCRPAQLDIGLVADTVAKSPSVSRSQATVKNASLRNPYSAPRPPPSRSSPNNARALLCWSSPATPACLQADRPSRLLTADRGLRHTSCARGERCSRCVHTSMEPQPNGGGTR